MQTITPHLSLFATTHQRRVQWHTDDADEADQADFRGSDGSSIRVYLFLPCSPCAVQKNVAFCARRFLAFILLLLGLASTAHAQSYTLRSSILSPGGEQSTGDGYTLYSTFGQAVTGPESALANNGDHQLGQGFWYHASGNAGPLALPTALDDEVTTDEDTPITLDVLANDVDPSGGALTIIAVGEPANGSVTQTGDSTLSYTPGADFFGDDAFTYQVQNEQGGIAEASVTVTIRPVNDAPVFTSTPVAAVAAGSDYRYTVETTDVDGDALTLSAPVLPGGWLVLTDNGDGTATLAGTPSNAEAGEHAVTLSIADGTATAEQSFTLVVTTVVPVVPILLAPENEAADLAADSVALVWQAVPGAASYDVQVATTDDFATTVAVGAGLADTTYTLTALVPNTTYFWRVRAINGLGESDYAAPYRFSTALNVASEDEAELPDRFALHPNYPNPFNPATTLSYTLPTSAQVKLVVYDLHGREVARLVDARQPAGRYQIAFDATGLASGVYLYRLAAGAFTELRRMVLVK